ncbi:MAG: helix-turn-helix domain-containing protein [Candidatus Competibacter sp.]
MTLLSTNDAARVAGISRRSIQRAIKEGRLSATTDGDGNRVIDTSELIRVYGELRRVADEPATMTHSVATEATLIAVLQNQLQHAQDQLEQVMRQAHEREQQVQQEKARLLGLLEAEQQARRDLETKLLPAPGPARTSNVRVWTLVGLLAVVAAFAGWHWRDRIVAALAP